jgi:putative transcriptional regulator
VKTLLSEIDEMPATRGKRAGSATRTSKGKGTWAGKRIIAGLEELLDALDSGGMAEVEKRFTVHHVRRLSFEKPDLSAKDIAKIRAGLGASQTAFAALLGVSANTVRAWEQGVNPPSGMASRFLAEIRRDPAYWKARMDEATRS